MPEQEVTILAKLKDNFSPVMRGILRGLKAVRRIAATAGKAMSASFRGAVGMLGRLKRGLFSLRSLLLAGAFAGIIKVFSDFETGLAQVSTLVDTAIIDMNKLGRAVIDVSKTTGESLESLNKSLFDTISAGVDANKAAGVLEIASKLAIGGGATTAEATKGLVAILNAYGLEAEDAAAVSDSLFQAMKGGITTIGELSSKVGKLAPVARIAGLSIDEMNAGIAALTKSGLSTAEATTSLRSILLGLIKPTARAKQTAELLGIALNTAAIKGGKFTEFLQEVADKTGLNEQLISALFGNIRAFAGVANLASDDVKNFRDILGTMADKAGSTEEAFKKMEETLGVRIRQLLATIKDFFITVGEAAKPFIVNVIDKLRNFVEGLNAKRNQVQAIIRQVATAIKQLVKIVKTIFQKGDAVTFITNIVSSVIQAGIRVIQAGVPVILRLARQIGRKIGIALIDSLIGSSSEALARRLASGKRGIERLAIKALGIDEEGLDELARQGRALLSAEQNLFIQQAKLAERERDKAARAQGRLGSPLGLGTQKVPDSVLRKRLKEAAADVERVRQGLAGSALGDMGTADAEATAQAIKDFSARIPEIANQFGQNLRSGLDPAIQAEIDRLGVILGDEWKVKLQEAAELDAATKTKLEQAGIEAGGAFSGGVGTGIQEGEGGGLNLFDIAEEVGLAFERVGERFEKFRSAYEENLALAREGIITFQEAGERNADLYDEITVSLQAVTDLQQMYLDQASSGELAFLTASFIEINEQLALMKVQLGDLTNKSENFLTGFSSGLQGTLKELGDLRELGLDVGKSLAEGLGDALVAVWDDGRAGLKAFLSDFLKSIAVMIAKALLAKMVFAAIGFGSGVISSLSGANRGGLLRRASGGPVPGPRINRDIVPAALTPGEYVHPRESVDYYGSGIMEAIRRRMIPRGVMARYSAPTRVIPKTHFATGGEVASLPVGPQPTYLVANDQALDQLLAGGKQAFTRYFRDNAPELRAILGGG